MSLLLINDYVFSQKSGIIAVIPSAIWALVNSKTSLFQAFDERLVWPAAPISYLCHTPSNIATLSLQLAPFSMWPSWLELGIIERARAASLGGTSKITQRTLNNDY